MAQQHSVTQQDVADQAAPLLLVRWWQSTHASVAQIASHAQSVANVPPETARQMLLEGVGIGFFTRTQITDALTTGQLREVPIADLRPITRESALVRLARQKNLSVVGTEFIAEVREVLSVGDSNLDTVRDFYRATARATGMTDTSQVVIQSTYARIGFE